VVADANTFCIIPDKSLWAWFRGALAQAGNIVPEESWWAFFGWANAQALVTIPNLRSCAYLWIAMTFA